MLSETEKKVINAIQGDIPVTRRPYRDMAKELGMDEDTLIGILKDLSRRGIIRRFGATLRHQKSGITANAMVAWQVDEARVEEVGTLFASLEEVTHCYRRNPAPDWPYNLYTMVHTTNEDLCMEKIRQMAEKAGVDRYNVLFSKRELKKTSMEYFVDEDD